ncbi:BTB/POZ and MATH domain-containing protein 2-like [Panicum miliaceum]|uniref:BTB/POZ and MATH domain-containing protein 2-like n=1 Tax=Panicum miliaceum TaxID=4540 RepID=A0A3L6PGE3_PANMI|nr:BTB/POZ and MATH domain-containing protein 2-like [Panicum miliaceum]
MASSLPTTLRMLRAAWCGAREALSFSSTRLRQQTGAHLHRIDRYSAVDAAALAGQRIESAATSGAPLLPQDVTAGYRVSILDGDGNRAFGTAVGPHRFRGRWSSAGAADVATVEELSVRAALRGGEGAGDGIVIRCDVTVTSLENESRIKWCIRQLVGKLSLDSVIIGSQVDESAPPER